MHLHAVRLNLRLQAATPSDHLGPTFLLPTSPQFLNQAPPGAQQLALPDFLNVPHFRHVIVLTVVRVLTMSSRSGIGRSETYSLAGRVVGGVGSDGHALRGIDPDESANMLVLLAFE